MLRTAAVAEWTDRYSSALMNTFGPPKRVLVRGEGAYLWDADGRRYLDLFAGIAVNALGHAHPLDRPGRHRSADHARPRLATSSPPPPQIALAETPASAWSARTTRRVFFCQLRHRGQRGRVQDHPAHRPHQDHLDRRRLPRPDHGRPGADRQARDTASRSSRCPATSTSSLTATSPRSPRRSTTRPRPSSSSRSRARTACVPPARIPAGRARDHRTRTARCCCSTRSRPASAAPARGSRYQPERRSQPDVVTLAKGLGGGMPIGACIALGARRGAAQPGLARHAPSAAIRSPAPRVSPCSDVIERDGLLANAGWSATGCASASSRSTIR